MAQALGFSDDELKLLLVAVRHMRRTFAEARGRDPAIEAYAVLYDNLFEKLREVTGPLPATSVARIWHGYLVTRPLAEVLTRPGRRVLMAKKCVISLWILGSALVVVHLLKQVASEPRGFWLFLCGALVCYSLPFFVLTLIRIPKGRSPQRYILLTLFVLVLGLNLFIPIRPLFPGYHPKALEDLGYLFLPLIELPLIALVFGLAAASAVLLRKDQ
jgi:hypothetical protein